jgi:hypothetical protein
MGNFDAAAVIQAAATSNLGVISLLALVLAFLAWRFFQRSSDRIKLVAFAMMFLGAAGFVAAVMLAGGDAKQAPAASETATAHAPEPASTDTAASTATDGAAATGAVNIAGVWRDSDGYGYDVRQEGSTFSYTFTHGGAVIGRGAGTLTGTRLTYSFVNDDHSSEGTCDGEVAPDGRMIRGTCRDGPDSWPFAIER